MKYKAIGFDYGGVVYGEPGGVFMQKLADFLDVPKSELGKVYFEHNHKVNLLGVSMDDLWRSVASDMGKAEQVEDFVRFINEVNAQKKVNQDILELIKTLREKGYKIGILSNYNTTLRERLDSQGITPLVDVIGSSEEMGYMKPQKEAFWMFCKMLSVEPSEFIFIDDTEKSLVTAHEVGYTPILFESYEKLENDLKQLGVL
ncbi:MAG: HAD-IA family hydrolase [Candidatus Moranbacteria bacterium]|nr:HAD-IA family hydrolase [Candidatus Moranbacteria bacterium]